MTKHHWEILNSGNIKVSNTPQELWEQAVSYFKWCDEHPIETEELIRTGVLAGTFAKVKLPRAYHVKGLCLHCGINEEYLKDIQQTKDRNSEYAQVVDRIMYAIYSQQYELASVGELNPVFTSKALNMDKEIVPNTSVKVQIVGDLPTLARSENEILEKLDYESTIVESED